MASSSAEAYDLYMLGDCGAGVWTFCERVTQGLGPMPDAYRYNRRVDFHVCTLPAITIHDQPRNPFRHDICATKLRVWNSSTRRFDHFPRATLRHVDAIIALYDVTSDESLKVAVRQLSTVTRELELMDRPVPVFLVANKSDLLVRNHVDSNHDDKQTAQESCGQAAGDVRRNGDEHAQHVRHTTDGAQRGGDHDVDECADFFASVGAMREYEAGVSAAASVGAEFGHSSSGPTLEVEALLRRVVAAVQQRECPTSSSALGGLRLPLCPPLLT